MATEPYADRARGVLLGLAVGDALGTTLEFTRPRAPRFPELAAGPHLDLVGGGPFNLKPGQITDDTQMACALATSLVKLGRFSQSDLARRYVAWRGAAFDVGKQIGAALAAIAAGAAPETAGRAVWLASGRHAAGNGSLMRTAPIAVFFANDEAARRQAALADSAITHADPRCQLACTAFDAALAAALTRSSQSLPAVMLEAAVAEISRTAEALLEHWPEEHAAVEEDCASLREDLAAACRADPELYGPELHLHQMQGFVRVAFRLAFWELMHAPGFEAGVIDVVNRGGDADTNGAIAGALLGAAHGAAAIPDRWIRRVLEALQDGPPGPLRDDFHPKRLLSLTGADPC